MLISLVNKIIIGKPKLKFLSFIGFGNNVQRIIYKAHELKVNSWLSLLQVNAKKWQNGLTKLR